MNHLKLNQPRLATTQRWLMSLLAVVLMTPGQLMAQVDRDQAREGWNRVEQGAMLIDVRSEAEFIDGHIEGALHIPYQNTDDLIQAIGPDKDRAVVMYCRSGRRVGLAIEALKQRGYTNVYNASGLQALRETDPNSMQ